MFSFFDNKFHQKISWFWK